MSKKFIIMLVILLLSVPPLVYTDTVSAKERSAFQLTDQEKEYLDSISNQPITLAITTELMSFETENGSFGLLKPLTDLMENQWGLKVEIVNCGWSDSFRELDNDEVDIIGLAILNNARKKLYYASEPLYTSTMTVYTRISDPLINITNLDSRTIGLVSGSALKGLMNQYIGSHTKIMYYDTIDEMFTALDSYQVDCAISALNAQSELLRYPGITCEADVETVLPSQGLYAKNERFAPLIELINRYLMSPSGTELLNQINEARSESVMEKAREFYAGDIEYLNTHYTELPVYDSGVLYPFHFVKDGVFEGIQADANKMFYQLTGMEIKMLPASEFSEGFITTLEKLKSNEIIGATGIYYNKAYDLDSDYIYSDPVYMDKLGFYATKELDSVYGLRIATTLFAAPYVDWTSIAGVEPVIYDDHEEMLKALREGEIDAAFVSEMGVDYDYTILSEHTLIRAVPLEAEANVHMIAGSEHEVFVRLFNVANLLDKTLNPENRMKWMDASRNDKYELIRVRNQLMTYQITFVAATILIILALAALLIVIYYNYCKFNSYDRQISQMLSTQKNADMLWGNTKTRRIISKGGFPFFKAWGFDVPDEKLYNIFAQDLDYIKRENEPYHVSETSFTIPADNSKHYVRYYTHRINESKFMVLALDVTDEKLREKNLSKLANTDSLSSLLTRRAMERELKKRIAENSCSSDILFVLMFDIDDFKKVNDSYGHDFGDKVLVFVANTIKDYTSGCVASRWGGEEFLVAVSCKDRDEVLSLAYGILKVISQNVILVGQRTSFSVTVSCGVSPIIGSNYEKAITHADKALYIAKNEGKNCVRYME